jgi:hypothetical protein
VQSKDDVQRILLEEGFKKSELYEKIPRSLISEIDAGVHKHKVRFLLYLYNLSKLD